MSNSCKVPEVKPITIKRFGTAGLVPTVPTTLDCNLWQKTDLKDGEFAINTVDNKLYIRSGNQILDISNGGNGGSGSVTSVGLTMPPAFTVANSPITSSGTLIVSGAGTTSDYIRGDGSLAAFPSIPTFTPSALTKIDDTNVTLTLGGTPSTALLENVSLTLGWTGNLAVSRGGTGAGTFTANSVLLGNGTSALQEVAPGTSGNVLTSNGTTWTSAAPTGGISGLTANRFVYATGATTVATDNNAFFDGTQIAFGTSSPIASTRTTIFGSGTTSSTFGLQVHNSTGTNNALVVRDDTKIGIGTSTFASDDILRISGLGGTGFQYTITNRSAGTGPVVNRFFSNIGEGRILKYGGATPVLTGFGVGDFGMWNDASGGRLVFMNATNNINSTINFHTANNATPRLSIQNNGNILVNTTTDVASSLLTLDSTTKGILIPRMTAAERAAISSPANGLLVIQTDGTEGLYRYQLSTTSWIFIG